VDYILVPATQTDKDSDEVALTTWEEIAPIVAPYQDSCPGLHRHRLIFESWPPEIAASLNQQRNPLGQLNGIGLDQILDREMVDAAGDWRMWPVTCDDLTGENGEKISIDTLDYDCNLSEITNVIHGSFA
jgi:hypothetical protein